MSDAALETQSKGVTGLGKGKVHGSGGAAKRPKRHGKVLKNMIERIGNPTFRRLMRQGGIKRIQHKTFDEVRPNLKKFLMEVIGNSVTYCEYARRKTVMADDVFSSLQLMNRPLYSHLSVSRYSKKSPSVPQKKMEKPSKEATKLPSGAVAAPALTLTAVPTPAAASSKPQKA